MSKRPVKQNPRPCPYLSRLNPLARSVFFEKMGAGHGLCQPFKELSSHLCLKNVRPLENSPAKAQKKCPSTYF